MALGVAALFVLVGAVLVGILRWMGVANTDQPGFTELTSFGDEASGLRARQVLERAGIPVVLDDHHGRAWGAVGGVTRVLVATNRLEEATTALRAEASYLEPKNPRAWTPRSWALQRWGILTMLTGFSLFVVPSILSDWPQLSWPLFIAGAVFAATGLLLIALGPMRDRQGR